MGVQLPQQARDEFGQVALQCNERRLLGLGKKLHVAHRDHVTAARLDRLLHVGLDQPLHAFARLALAGQRFLQRCDQPLQMLLQHRKQEIVLRREVVVEHRLGRPARLGHILHLGRGVALLGEKGGSAVHDGLALGFIVV
ncbi:hypothetical protein D3C71_1478450 [compost metagenome]